MSPAHDMLNVAAELAADETTTLAARPDCFALRF